MRGERGRKWVRFGFDATRPGEGGKKRWTYAPPVVVDDEVPATLEEAAAEAEAAPETTAAAGGERGEAESVRRFRGRNEDETELTGSSRGFSSTESGSGSSSGNSGGGGVGGTTHSEGLNGGKR